MSERMQIVFQLLAFNWLALCLLQLAAWVVPVRDAPANWPDWVKRDRERVREIVAREHYLAIRVIVVATTITGFLVGGFGHFGA